MLAFNGLTVMKHWRRKSKKGEGKCEAPARPPTGLIRGHSAASSMALILLCPRASEDGLPDDDIQ